MLKYISKIIIIFYNLFSFKIWAIFNFKTSWKKCQITLTTKKTNYYNFVSSKLHALVSSYQLPLIFNQKKKLYLKLHDSDWQLEINYLSKGVLWIQESVSNTQWVTNLWIFIWILIWKLLSSNSLGNLYAYTSHCMQFQWVLFKLRDARRRRLFGLLIINLSGKSWLAVGGHLGHNYDDADYKLSMP